MRMTPVMKAPAPTAKGVTRSASQGATLFLVPNERNRAEGEARESALPDRET